MPYFYPQKIIYPAFLSQKTGKKNKVFNTKTFSLRFKNRQSLINENFT
jgi:hypothetical protein